MKRRVKKLVMVITLLFFVLTGPGARADFDPEVNYMTIMVRAALAGDIEAGRAAEICRNESIDRSGEEKVKISFEDLFLLSKIITAEAGSDWLGDEWRMCVGEVVMNRVASPEFPDTVREVIYEPGQYEDPGSFEFDYMLDPTEAAVFVSLRLLQGERIMDPWVVYQANFKQGGGVYAQYYDSVLGYTYFCSSSNPDLYW